MRDLQKYAVDCMEMLDCIGIEYGNIIEIVPNSRAKARWGQCKAIPGGYSININVELLDERNDEDGLINTIIHELLHSAKGCMNHGENWQRLANIVYREYGLNIKRTSSAAEKGMCDEAIKEHIAARKSRTHNVEYIIKCECCGHTYKRYKASKLTKHPDWFRCGNCNGALHLV